MEFRQNIATREWVLFSPDRGKRPEDFCHRAPKWTHELPARREECPFCPGNEDERTPGETLRYVDAQGGWSVRCFPNRFPAVLPVGDYGRHGDDFHHAMGAVGQHDIVAESRLHNTTMGLQSVHEVRQVLLSWRERLQYLRRREEAEHAVVFKNHGNVAGSSLEHPHSQIVSLPVTPWQVRHRMEEAMRFYDDHGDCVFCRMVEIESRDGERVVGQGEFVTAFIPYAAYSSFSIWMLPRRHHCCLSQTGDEELDELATHLRLLLAQLYHGLHDPPFNLVVRVANRDSLEVQYFHWYISIVPRLQKSAGFELGTGMFINTTLPEFDAAFLRNVRLPAATAAVGGNGASESAG